MELDLNVHISDELEKFLHRAIGRIGDTGAVFKGRLHPTDEMFYKTVAKIHTENEAYLQYITSGCRTMDVIRRLGKDLFGGLDACDSVLEFASGHGRLTRHLIREMPVERIWASDIYGSAVEWQRSYFGVQAFASAIDPRDLVCDRTFQFIIVGSLFSHLPKHLFEAWLTTLLDRLRPDGVLCISTVDAATNTGLMRIGELGSDGFLFVPMTGESDTLPSSIYGRTVVTEEYLKDIFNRCGGPSMRYRILKTAMYENQDICLLTRSDGVDLSLPSFGITPLGGIGGAWREPNDTLAVNGWGVDLNPGGQIGLASLLAGGRVIATTKAVVPQGTEARDIMQYFPGIDAKPANWLFRIRAQDWSPGTLMTVVLASEAGPEAEIFLPFAERLRDSGT